MLLTNVLSPRQPSQSETPPAQSQPTEPTQEDQSQTETTSSAGSGSATQPAASEKPASVVAVQNSPQAPLAEAPAARSAAENEAFARAAAQRNVDSIRTRALIDGISPVNNGALQAAKSYLNPVEPKADAVEANAKTQARPETAKLDKAA